MRKIVTEPYQFPRLELAKISAVEYLRAFWWFVLIIPTFGLFAVLLSDGILRMVGAMALLWPLTIPGRSMLSSTKASRLFTQPCFMEADEDEVIFYSVRTEPKRLRFVFRPNDIRDVVSRGDTLLLRTRRFGFAPIKKAAFKTQEDERTFEEIVSAIVEKRIESEIAAAST